MFVISTEKDYQSIIDYIGNDYTQCLYLYLNIKKYGYSNPNVKIYINRLESDINAVFLKYYDCLHCFSHSPSYTSNMLIDTIKKINPKTFFLPYALGQGVLSYFSDAKNYDIMDVYKNCSVDVVDNGYKVFLATKDDVEALASFMMRDTNYSKIYTFDELLIQNRQRIEDGFSRTYIIRNEFGNVISSASTNAEIDKIAVIGNIETDVAYRGKGLGKQIISHLFHSLANEGITSYSFIEAPESRHIHEKMGSIKVDKIIKFYPKE